MIVVSTYNSENCVTNEFNCSYNINRMDQIISINIKPYPNSNANEGNYICKSKYHGRTIESNDCDPIYFVNL